VSDTHATFYELVTPPQRAMRNVGESVEQLTSLGWKRTGRRTVPKGCVEVEESVLRQRCLQRLNDTPLRADVLPRPRAGAAPIGSVREWIAPPLPYGAPVMLNPATEETASQALADSLKLDFSEAVLADLVQQSRDGFRGQEARVAAVEGRAGAFEGYAAAAAGIAAVGAALLSRGDTKTFGDPRDYALVAALVAALSCLILSGIRAYQAAAKRFDWLEPNDPEHVFARAHEAPQNGHEIYRLTLTSLLIATTRAQLLADWKLDRFKQASRYFSFALIWVIAAAVLLVWPG
jgi:hypothetical protein